MMAMLRPLAAFGLWTVAVTASRHDRGFAGIVAAAMLPPRDSDSSSNNNKNWLDGLELEDPATDAPAGSVDSLLDCFQTHPLLQIPCRVSHENGEAVWRTYCDTGAQHSVVSYSAVVHAGLLPLLDRRFAGHAVGVGKCRVLGRLPAGACMMHVMGDVNVPSPSITVLEGTGVEGVEFLLGLDFLREYQAVLDLKEEELQLTVASETVRIPFLRPRLSSFGSVDDKDGLGGWQSCRQHDLSDDDEEDEMDVYREQLDMSGV